MCAQVPWSKLGTEPVVAEFDRLYIVASPRQDDSGSGACPQNVDDAVAAAQAAEQAAKQQRIDTAEDTWLKVCVFVFVCVCTTQTEGCVERLNASVWSRVAAAFVCIQHLSSSTAAGRSFVHIA